MAIYYKDNGLCKICGKEVSFDEAEIDHVIPWSEGGTTTVNNGQLVCPTCNRSKGNRS
nr:HNH endonuclease signature motif containing protein [Methanobacterium petrolearium]